MKNKSSSTASLIAESLYTLSHDKRLNSLIPNRLSEMAYLFGNKKFSLIKNNILFRSVFNFLQNKTIPGIKLHYLLRKKRIEEFVRAAIDQGFQQIIVLGAGFDSLSMRLSPEFPKIEFIEIDFPSTQFRKIEVLNKNNLTFPNLSFISIDLTRQSLSGKLTSSLFETNVKSCFVAEGLLMYLEETDVRKIFSSIQKASSKDLLFIFTFMDKNSHESKIRFKNSSALVDIWLHLHGEPFKWGINHLLLPEFLTGFNFEPVKLETDETFRRLYLTDKNLCDEVLAQGEYLCLARKYEPQK